MEGADPTPRSPLCDKRRVWKKVKKRQFCPRFPLLNKIKNSGLRYLQNLYGKLVFNQICWTIEKWNWIGKEEGWPWSQSDECRFVGGGDRGVGRGVGVWGGGEICGGRTNSPMAHPTIWFFGTSSGTSLYFSEDFFISQKEELEIYSAIHSTGFTGCPP